MTMEVRESEDRGDTGPLLVEDCIFEIGVWSMELADEAVQEWFIWRSLNKNLQKRFDRYYLESYGMCCTTQTFVKIPHLCTSLWRSIVDPLEKFNIDVIIPFLKDSVLESLDLSEINLRNYAKDLAEVIRNNKTINYLALNKAEIDDEGAKIIGDALTKNNSIQSLGLSLNPLTGIGMESIIAGIANNKSLLLLNVGGYQFGDEIARFLARYFINSPLRALEISQSTFGMEGMESLGEFLSQNNHIYTLNLFNSGICQQKAKELFAILESNIVSRLILNGNLCGAEEATFIANFLSKNNRITELDLSCNPLGDQGMRPISDSLLINKSLTRLDLMGADIKSGVSIGEFLSVNKSLLDLDISYNEIGNEGGISIARGLSTNNSLTQLNLSSNQIGNEGAIAIAQSLATNNSLTLYLYSNQIGDEGLKELGLAGRRDIKLYL